VTFESPDVTAEAALRYYHFELDVLGPPHPPQHRYYFHSVNTLPSNSSRSYFPGFFHSEPNSRLLALEAERPTDSLPEGDSRAPLHILYIPHDVLLGYIMSHPSDTETVVVPWETWGLGNARIITLPDLSPVRFVGSKIVCGMHAMTDPPMIIGQGDQKMLRVVDCHPRRVALNTVTHLRLGGAVDSREGLGPSSTTGWQEVCDEKTPYVFKDIPLPDGLRWENMGCMLGEDVVVVFEVGISFDIVVRILTPFKYSLGTPGDIGQRIEKMFYHPI
jgi:hypothetical protein